MKEMWNRYSIVIVILLAVYSAYKTFMPVDVKVIKTEHTKVVTDRTEEMKLRAQVVSLKQKVREYSRNIQEDEVVIETKYPDGRVERRVEKKKTTTESGTSTNSSASTSSTAVDGKTGTTTSTTTDSKTTTVTNTNRLWTTQVGILYNHKILFAGHGINIGKNLTGMAHFGYNITQGITERDRWDFGGSVMFRW